MYIITDQMKSTADYAIRVAKERFKLELDYSEQSIARLENILGQIYWGFSNHTKDESEDGVILNTAIIWGSYLGEYIRLKMGGIWILKGSDPLVSIRNNEFSPINLVYQKITNHPEYSLEDFLVETKRIINTSVINSQQSRYRSEIANRPQEQISSKQSRKPVAIDKRLILTLAGIGGLLFVILVFVVGYKIIKTGRVSAVGLISSATGSYTNIPTEKIEFTATSNFTSTPYPTATLLPTYTPIPMSTQHPSYTPSLTYTPTLTAPPTDTQTPISPTLTRIPLKSSTPVQRTPTDTHIPSTEGSPPTATAVPPPTATEPPPIVIESCEVNPSTVPAGFNVTIAFIVHFSAPGYGFTALNPEGFPGQTGCSGTDSNSDGTADCNGSSGLLPSSTKIDVTIKSSVGDCTVSYSSQ